MAFVTPGPNPRHSSIDFGVIVDSFHTIIAHWQAYLIAGVVMVGSALPAAIIGLIPSPSLFGFPSSEFDSALLLTAHLLWFIPSLFVVPLMGIGVTKFSLYVSRGHPADNSHLWEGFRNPFRYVWVVFLTGLVTLLGLFAFCVGAYVTGGLMMFAYALKVDTGASGGDCVRASWDMLKREWVMAAVFCFVVGIIAGLGGAVESIGAMFTLPYLYVAQVHLYNRFTGYYLTPPPPANPNSPYPRPRQGPGNP